MRIGGMMLWLAVLVAATGCNPGQPAETSARTPVTWHTDFEAAKALAEKEGRPILADFEGSDWCGWCQKLEAEVWSREPFAEYAREAVVLFKADFPRKKEQPKAVKEQNEALAKQYEIEGFPTVLLLNHEGEELARTGYRSGGAAAYVEHLEGLLDNEETGKE